MTSSPQVELSPVFTTGHAGFPSGSTKSDPVRIRHSCSTVSVKPTRSIDRMASEAPGPSFEPSLGRWSARGSTAKVSSYIVLGARQALVWSLTECP